MSKMNGKHLLEIKNILAKEVETIIWLVPYMNILLIRKHLKEYWKGLK